MNSNEEEQKLGRIRGAMYGKTLSFREFWNAYYKGQADDTDLMSRTTQPFWQSMRLSKKRLETKGLTMETRLVPDTKHNSGRDGGVMVQKNGSDLSGCSICDMKTERIFWKDGKRIYKKRDREICTTSILQSDVEAGQAACPNCGYVAPISSFIDGCDSCGSKYTVSDFEAKISGFSLEENVKKKILFTMKNTITILAGLTVGFLIIGTVAFFLLGILLVNGRNGVGAVGSLTALLFSADLVGILFRSIIISGFLFGFGGAILLAMKHDPIVGEGIAKAVIEGFSGNDFYQNLEYKLRNIHLTERAEDVAAFASIPLDSIVSRYEDVVDCDMTKLDIKNVYRVKDGYQMDAQVKVRMITLVGKRISEKYEDIKLTLFGRADVVHGKVTALREFKCCNCGSTINLLEGSTCAYCGSKFDYSDYGWIITGYEPLKKKHNLYREIKVGMFAAYAMVLGVHLIALSRNSTENSWLSLTKEVKQEWQFFQELYQDIPMPEELWAEAVLVDSTDELIERTYTYELPMDEERMLSYRNVFLEKEYIPYNQGPNYFTVWKYAHFEPLDEEAYIKISTVISENGLKLYIEILEDINE